MTFHNVTIQEALQELGTDMTKGLTENRVQEMREK